MVRNHESLDDVLNRTGPEQLDYTLVQLDSESIIGQDSSDGAGLIDSLLHQRTGSQVDGVGEYQPGRDAAHNIDIRASYASGRAMARKHIDTAAPDRLHIVLDQPERLGELTGNYSAHRLGMFITALSVRVAGAADTDIAVYHNDGNTAGLLFEGHPADAIEAFDQIEGKQKRRLEQACGRASIRNLLDLVNQDIDDRHDTALVISDFLDGYAENSQSFDWQHSLQATHAELSDRLWAVRLTSPAQTTLPPAVSSAMDFDTIQSINRQKAAATKQRQQAVGQALRPLENQEHNRLLNVDTFRRNNPAHPVLRMSQFILGEVAQ